MGHACLLYYITDRTALAPDEPTRHRRVLEKIAEATCARVDYIQLRERDLPTRDLESLAAEAMGIIAQLRTANRELRTTLLINSRTDVALAVGADGVHLRSEDISPHEVRAIWKEGQARAAALGCPAVHSTTAGGALTPGNSPRVPLVGTSCHSPAEVARAAANAATFAVFGPVLEKKDARPIGLAQLQQACQTAIPVLALGGVTVANARSCLEAGAAGIAAIRLFQENDVEQIVRALHSSRWVFG